jgi:GrpB-like predicted nucleotidyltransferase (UPF0157 family)
VTQAGDRVPLPPPDPLNGPVVLADYDPDWPAWYDALAGRVRAALGGRVVALNHAGSTSVPGLAAKPLIDMLLEVADSADEAAYVPDLEAADFVLRIREPDWFEHRLLKSASPPANLHVYTAGEEEVRRMLTFRDHLRRDPADRALYEATKRTLAARTWAKTQDYADAKSEVVAEIMSRALAWP